MGRWLATIVAAALVVGAAQEQEMVDNPEYLSWSDFKVGSWIRFEQVTTASGVETKYEVLRKLLDLSSQKAVVEFRIRQLGKEGDPVVEKREIPARIAKTEQKRDRKDGKEVLEIAGRKYLCTWVEFSEEKDGNTLTEKTWHYRDFPGGLARMESKTEGKVESLTRMIAQEWKSE